MKKTALFVFLLLLSAASIAQAQDFDKKIMVGIFTNAGINQPIRLTRKYITEDVGPFHGDYSWSAGLKFSGMLSQKMRIEFTAGYSEHKAGFELSPPIYPESKVYPETIKTYFIQAILYRYLNKDFFLSVGTVFDFEITRKSYWIDSQNGIGFSVGAGREFHIKSFVIDIAPTLELHSVIPFSSVEDQQRLLVLGLRLGLGYCFYERDKKEANTDLNRTNY